MISEAFASHYDVPTFIVENETFKCTDRKKPAIRLEWPKAQSIAKCGAIIRNCVFEPGTDEWSTPIEIVNGWHVVIDHCNIVSGPTGKLQVGVRLLGHTMNTRIMGLTCTHANVGVLIADESEGTKIGGGTEILAAHIGIIVATPQGEAGLWVGDTHISAKRCGIAMHNRHQANLHDLLIYRYDNSEKDWSAISFGPGCWNGRAHDIDVCTFGWGGTTVYEEPGLNNDWSPLTVREIRER